MPSCAIPTCRKIRDSKAKDVGITFHRFPTDEIKRMQWTKVVQKARIDPYWKPGEHSLICSRHFDEIYLYTTKGGYRRLKKEAIPTKEIAMFVEETEVRAEIEAVLHPSTSVVNYAQHVNSPPKSPAASEIGEVDITNLNYIFDSPRKAKLRKELEKNKIKCKRHVNLIKNLKRKNRRLILKNAALKNILKNLKNNRYISDDVFELLSTNVVAAD